MLPTRVADAAYLGKDEPVKEFLDAGGAIDAQCEERDGGTLLMAAATGGVASLVRLLLSRNADISLRNTAGLCPLMGAVHQPGGAAVLELLLRAGADVEARNPLDGAFPLLYAAESGDLGVVLALLRAGANPDAQKDDGGTALMAAAHSARLDVVSALIGVGAALELKNSDGATALLGAAQQGHTKVVRRLLAARADATPRCLGRTALEWASVEGHGETVALMQRHARKLEVEAARASRAKEELQAREAAAEAAMASLLEEEEQKAVLEERLGREGAAKEKRAKAKKARRQQERLEERQSCPSRAELREVHLQEDVAALDLDDPRQTGAGPSTPRSSLEAPLARRLLSPAEAHGGARYPPVSDEVRRWLDTAKMHNDDKRAAAALLARHGHRHDHRHSV